MKTTVDKIWFCKGQRVPSKRYKENYDSIFRNSNIDVPKAGFGDTYIPEKECKDE